MLRPSPAELLTGVADALETTVLGELGRGVARNQVVAAIGIVRRCAAAVDRQGPLLHADVADLVTSLAAIAAAEPGLVPAPERAPLEEALQVGRRLLASGYPSVPELIEADLALREAAATLGVEAERTGSSQAGALRELFGGCSPGRPSSASRPGEPSGQSHQIADGPSAGGSCRNPRSAAMRSPG